MTKKFGLPTTERRGKSNPRSAVYVGRDGKFIVIFKVRGAFIGFLTEPGSLKPERFVSEEEAHYLIKLDMPRVYFQKEGIIIYDDNIDGIGRDTNEVSLTIVQGEQVHMMHYVNQASDSEDGDEDGDSEFTYPVIFDEDYTVVVSF